MKKLRMILELRLLASALIFRMVSFRVNYDKLLAANMEKTIDIMKKF